MHQSEPGKKFSGHEWDRQISASAGFTLLELLIVLGIVALLASVAAPQVLRYLGTAKTETARAQISAISTAVELYALDNGTFPPAANGLRSLVEPPAGAGRWRGPYLKRADGLVDPWGRAYHYRVPGKKSPFEVYTFGRDNAPGGTGEDQDLVNW
ncbi:MAG: type secretion system major pseudopilin GspG [Pseudomonadota bacterium]